MKPIRFFLVTFQILPLLGLEDLKQNRERTFEYSYVPEWSEDYTLARKVGSLWEPRNRISHTVRVGTSPWLVEKKERLAKIEEGYRRAQKSLISRPGHARELMAYIHEARDVLLEHPDGNEEFPDRFIQWTFPAFWGMPSVETVEVLMAELDDIRPYSEAEEYRPQKLGIKSARALINLLEDPPTTHLYRPDEWLAWGEAVRNGASFKFKDLEGRYTLEGKVKAVERRQERLPDAAERKGMGSGKSRGAEADGERHAPPLASSWAYGAAGLLFLAALLYLGIVKGRQASG
jgi:hypothetical protein